MCNCLEKGLKLAKIYRILEFKKFYLSFKCLVNSIFGKTVENVDKRVNIILSTYWEN